MNNEQKILIIAGPNGAGKTTFAREYLPLHPEYQAFLNADLLAVGISPLHPARAAIRAGRMMLTEMRAHTRSGRSFAFETTLAGRGYLRMIDHWRAKHYTVDLLFLSLASPEEAIARVRLRVSQGGHDIPEATIRRRFHAGLRNFLDNYRQRVDHWLQYDANSSPPILQDQGGSTHEN